PTAQPAGFDLSTASPVKPPPGTALHSTVNAAPAKPAGGPLDLLTGPLEGAAHISSQLASFPVAAGASLYKLATAPSGLKAKEAAQASQDVTQAMTYQPRTTGGQAVAGAT